ncbi:acetolactate synthase [Marinococcus halophilus]|uniref:Acetolactate synthase n=1 Tax=Marinococcus halophilus TaxID=1371 RepID=A0A510Y5I7_MARHA|nr:thiamine pyrophosphate-binding protein [Marinococcus halophilus]OZT79799.1 acetolactate synthase [Marinococcus halophilus]GEK58619.1 acetolactate synthase [Marinococcus halophilus]
MKAAQWIIDYLRQGGLDYVFGIPAGSVNALFDKMYEHADITPIITKHEGAAGYMAAAYAKRSDKLGVCIASSGPGATNLLSGAANAMREQTPVLFITGSVPTSTVGLNASQELDVVPMFAPVAKYSRRVESIHEVREVFKEAVCKAFAGIPGPVHVAVPINIQLSMLEGSTELLEYPAKRRLSPVESNVSEATRILSSNRQGIIFLGQGAKDAMPDIMNLVDYLGWPAVTTPQAKGLVPTNHPNARGVYGFAGHQTATEVMEDRENSIIFIIGSSLGETATNNWNPALTADRFVIQLDHDPTVFDRKYKVDISLLGDAQTTILEINNKLRLPAAGEKSQAQAKIPPQAVNEKYETQNVLQRFQSHVPENTLFTVDIGEFMSYVIHYMDVKKPDTYDINVHFGAMGSGISNALGAKLADPERPVVSITGDGCFFMHGMEVLTAKEYQLPILFIVMNNARLGMVYHGHRLQYGRMHDRFEQSMVPVAAIAEQMGVKYATVRSMEDITPDLYRDLCSDNCPAVLEIQLIDEQTPPMGDRVKFLSSFSKS